MATVQDGVAASQTALAPWIGGYQRIGEPAEELLQLNARAGRRYRSAAIGGRFYPRTSPRTY